MIKSEEVSRLLGIFLDTETNGIDPQKHEAIEIAIELVDLGNGNLVDSYHTLIHISKERFDQSNLDSLAFTGITYEELQSGKAPDKVKEELLGFFKKHNLVRKKALFICQNPAFDRAFFSKLISPDVQEKLNFPYKWLDLASMHWAKSIEVGKDVSEIQLSKDQIASEYSLPPEERPHRAQNGTRHLVECYKKVVGFRQALKG